ncbi:MAG: glycosyltransferase [Lachnospiraceae bacterium]
MNRGGAESMIMNYYRHIDRAKVQFDFMVHRQEKGAFDDEIEEMGGKIYRMPPIYPQNFLKYWKMLNSFFELHKEYRIIHSHMSELGYFAFKVAKKHHVPIRICHAHNAPDFSRECVMEWIKLLPRLYFIHHIRKYTTHFFVCSHIAGLWLYGKKYARDFIFMKNAIETAKFAYQGDEIQRLRQNYNINEKLIICHVGRFNTQKNHSFLIDIFKKIKEKEPNSLLLLAGDGPLRKRMEQKVELLGLKDSVRFLGIRKDIPEILKVSEFLLFPSIYEGLSVVLVEAQASGIKCLFTDSLAQETIICSHNITRHSLKEFPEIWADSILAQRGYKRENMTKLFIEQGWDIHTSAQWLENYYLSIYHSAYDKK